MPEKIENRMVVDSQWDELEYGLTRKKSIYERMREAYEEAERSNGTEQRED